MCEALNCMAATLKQVAVATAIFTTGTLSTVMAQPGSPPLTQREAALETSNKAAVQAAFDGWTRGDGNALQALLSDDIEWTISGNSVAAGTTHGRTELMQKVLTPFNARFAQSSDRFRPRRLRGVYADGDHVIAQFDGAGTTNDGQIYENTYVWILTMRDAKVIRATAFFDSIAFDAMWRRVAPAER